VVYLDKAEKQLVVLGEVNKQFVVSPNVEALMSALDNVAKNSDENLVKME
jgi:DNA-directed RNA polymerase III subunit RPC4